MSSVPVAETFYSVQGEGPFAGRPAVFLRTAGCNLCCGGWDNMDRESQNEMEPLGDATWVCDTIDVWREPDASYTPQELIEHWEGTGILSALADGAHLILTGGEPTLPARQEQLVELLEALCTHANPGQVEVETNGTVKPTTDFERRVSHFNVSLKLANSGMEAEERLNPDAIAHYASMPSPEFTRRTSAVFKFVVSSEEDMAEIQDLVDTYDIPPENIMLMPAGRTQADLAETYPVVAEIVKEHGYGFSPRLHINIWNQMTGV